MMDEIYKSEKKEPKELLNYVIGWNVSTKLIINVTTFTLGSRPRQTCKGVGQEWILGVRFHAPGSVGKCEGMNPHTPKWTPTLGVRVLMDS
jgi:hypothetical protein